MNKKVKITIVLIIGIIIIIGLFYTIGFISGFKNYGEHGNWKPIKEYHFNTSKQSVEQNLQRIISTNSATIWFADSGYKFSDDGWSTVFIKEYNDTVQYIYRFKGDSLSWAKEGSSSIFLYSITDKQIDVTPTTINNISKKQIQERLMLFKTTLIEQIE